MRAPVGRWHAEQAQLVDQGGVPAIRRGSPARAAPPHATDAAVLSRYGSSP